MGAPHIYPAILAFLKANAGKTFEPAEISKALGHAAGRSIVPSLNKLRADNPAHIVRLTRGNTGRLARWGYSVNGTGNGSEPQSAVASEAASDLLITIPIGDNKSTTLTMPQARRVWEQLNTMFGRGAK